MKNEIHLTNKEIILYVNNRLDELDKSEIKKIEKHLLKPCSECINKVKELKLFNNTLGTIKNGMGTDDTVRDSCMFSNFAEDFIENKLQGTKRDEFINHIASCNTCREMVSVLYKNKALKEKYEEDGIWLEIIEGYFRLKDVIGNFPVPNLIGNDTLIEVFRGEYHEGQTKIDVNSREIELPEDMGLLRILWIPQKNDGSKISVQLFNSEIEDVLIEFYDENKELLKSANSSGAISCFISQNKCNIVIGRKVEIPVDLDLRRK